MTTDSATTLLQDHDRRGLFTDRAFHAVAVVAGFSVLVLLALILVSTTGAAWPAFRGQGLGFFTSTKWDVPHNEFGALAFAWGTLVVSGIALVLAVPVSIGISLYITEVAPKRLRKSVIYIVDLLATIPSVVYGLWGVRVLAPWIDPRFESIAVWFDSIPVLNTVFSGRPVSGVSFMTAGIIVGIMIIPIITSLTREVFATVPSSLKEGAYAIGATRWEMIRGAVFPHSRSGITAAVMIGLGRAMGETIAVALVIGSSSVLTARLFNPGDAMASVIANQFGESTGEYRAALIGLGVVLFFVTFLVNGLARVWIVRGERKAGITR